MPLVVGLQHLWVRRLPSGGAFDTSGDHAPGHVICFVIEDSFGIVAPSGAADWAIGSTEDTNAEHLFDKRGERDPQFPDRAFAQETNACHGPPHLAGKTGKRLTVKVVSLDHLPFSRLEAADGGADGDPDIF